MAHKPTSGVHDDIERQISLSRFSREHSRQLNEAGKSVFRFSEEPCEDDAGSGCCGLGRPKLCWMLVSAFLLITGLICFAITFLWYETSKHEETAMSKVYKEIWHRSEDVSEASIDDLIRKLVLQDMNVEMLAVAEYTNMPYLAVKMLGGAMDQGVFNFDTVDMNIRHLWWLQTQLPSLERRFAWGGIPKLENIYFADEFGLYAFYSNECAVNYDWPNCTTEFTYNFRFRPRDGTNHMTPAVCPEMCPSSLNATPGHANSYMVDSASGRPAEFLRSRRFDPRDRVWWKRAVEASPAVIWTDVHELSRDEVVHGFSVARAFKQEGKATMVVGATLTVLHISQILKLRVTRAAQHRAPDGQSVIFIIDEQGRMVASSTGASDVICKGSAGQACTRRMKLWNQTQTHLVKEAVSSLLLNYNESLANVSEFGLHVNLTSGYIFSHYRLGMDEAHNVSFHWIIVRAQPIDAYKKEIMAEKERSQKQSHAQQQILDKNLMEREQLTIGLCVVWLMAGSLVMSSISWLISRRLIKIASEMNKVAQLDFGDTLEPCDTTLDSSSSPSVSSRVSSHSSPWCGDRDHSMIREVAKISKSFENMKAGLRSFTRYMDPCIVQVLVQSGKQARLGVAKAKVTVFFSDIANFTSMAETLEPAVLASVLGEYLQDMSSIIMKHDGIVGEFIGDEIMAWWGAPWDLGSQHTVMALSAALEQQQQLEKLRRKWSAQGLGDVKARMGLVCGPVLAGNIGSRSRMKYGLVGDNVNLASRLEQLCKRYGVSILLDSNTCNEDGVRDAFFLRPVDLVTVKGRSEPTELYELVASKSNAEDLSQLDTYSKFCDGFAAVQDLYRNGDFQGAVDAIEAYQKFWPTDRPSSLLKEKCKALLEDPPGLEWSPVERLSEK